MTTPDPGSDRQSRRRQRNRRRVVLVTSIAVVIVAGLGVTYATLGGRDPDSVVTDQSANVSPTNPPTALPTTTTTLVASPELIVPPTSADATAATLTRVERALRGDDRDPAKLRVLG